MGSVVWRCQEPSLVLHNRMLETVKVLRHTRYWLLLRTRTVIRRHGTLATSEKLCSREVVPALLKRIAACISSLSIRSVFNHGTVTSSETLHFLGHNPVGFRAVSPTPLLELFARVDVLPSITPLSACLSKRLNPRTQLPPASLHELFSYASFLSVFSPFVVPNVIRRHSPQFCCN